MKGLKKFGFLGLVVLGLAAFVVGMCLIDSPLSAADDTPAPANVSALAVKSIEAETITAKSIVVENGKHRIAIGNSGIWITEHGQSTPCVAIYLSEDSPVIGMHSKDSASLCHPVAMYVDKVGRGVLQMLGKDGQATAFTRCDLLH